VFILLPELARQRNLEADFDKVAPWIASMAPINGMNRWRSGLLMVLDVIGKDGQLYKVLDGVMRVPTLL